MARKIIDTGVIGNDGTGDSIRDSFRKTNDNFRELYSSLGLGERITFLGLSDTPSSYIGVNNANSGATAFITVNPTETGLDFKLLVPGVGISLDYNSHSGEIVINSEFAEMRADPNPQLGGNMSVKSGSLTYKILDLAIPTELSEASNKQYVDTKISLAGVDAIDPATDVANTAMGRMTGPLVLSRDPIYTDDATYNGLIAATKQYVDSASFSSNVNLFVATSGEDYRPTLNPEYYGRALAYAYASIEAALKRAEEIELSSRNDLGPYKKLLTYNQGASYCTLAGITTSGATGAGFAGTVQMSVDTLTISSLNSTNYAAGDIITIEGGNIAPGGSPAQVRILSTYTSPGAVSTFEIISIGVYTALPGHTNVTTLTDSEFGTGLTFNVTYKVSNIGITTPGTGYTLVSARITGGGGVGAFGTAYVTGGTITNIVITDSGAGFTSIPSVVVDLPRFLIRTDFYRTDFTGDVLTNSAEALRTRDIREGQYLRGETSGALAQILIHTGELDSDGNEIFDVDIKSGAFIQDEELAYGDIVNNTQITIYVESGIYDENYPLRIPKNVSIIGDDARRVIIRPIVGSSTSPWAYNKFRRDTTVDVLTTTDNLFGYQYLTNTVLPVYPKTNNAGLNWGSAQLIAINKSFLQEEVLAWIDFQIINAEITSYWYNYTYNTTLARRDYGFIIDSLVFDLRYGSYNRITSYGLKYSQGTNLIGSNATATIAHLNTLIQSLILNSIILDLFQPTIGSLAATSISISSPAVITRAAHGLSPGDSIRFKSTGTLPTGILSTVNYFIVDNGFTVDTFRISATLGGESINTTGGITTGHSFSKITGRTDVIQITDYAYRAETGSGAIILALCNVLDTIIHKTSLDINYPLSNNEMDVFLCNDATVIRGVGCQGHGGFMMVFDPEGQISSKSPYCQDSTSVSKSIDAPTFAGGVFADGFTGNLPFKIISNISTTKISVSELDRIPNLPASFIVNDTIYRVLYVREFLYSPSGSTAQLILDQNTPWTTPVFTYDSATCSRDLGLILDGLGYDMVFDTNFNSRKSAYTYRQASAVNVISQQKVMTMGAITYAHTLAHNAISNVTYVSQQAIVNTNSTVITNVIDLGTVYLPTLTITNPPGLSTDRVNVHTNLLNNFEYIKEEAIGWINAQIAGNISPFTTAYTYDATLVRRDIGYVIEALMYDLVYGGNSQTRDAGFKYYPGVIPALSIPTGTQDGTAATFTYVRYLAKQVVQNLNPTTPYSSVTRVAGTSAGAGLASEINTLILNIETIITSGTSASDALALPSVITYVYNATAVAARALLVSARTSITTGTIDWITTNGNRYELLMPGNRSMLCTNVTQINDMGFGVLASNGARVESAGMFTYYNYISLYSLNGGLIRSTGSASSYGSYAGVAQGSDPLEVKPPTEIYHNLSQRVDCYFPSGEYANTLGGASIYINNYDTIPLEGTSLEIDHVYIIARYIVSSVSLAITGVYRLTLTSDSTSPTSGLVAVVANGTKLTLRNRTTLIVAGNLIDVSVRPSTGLRLAETSNLIYRLIQISAFDSSPESTPFSVTVANPGVFSLLCTITTIATNLCTTSTNHSLKIGDQFVSTSTTKNFISGATYYVISVPQYNQFTVSASLGGTTFTLVDGTGLTIVGHKTHKLIGNFTITLASTGTLPTGLSLYETYYVSANNMDNTTFRLSLSKDGDPINITGSGSGTQSLLVSSLTKITTLEQYDYIQCSIYQPGEYTTTSQSATSISIASPAVITKASHGLSIGNAIRFESTGTLPTGILSTINYFVITAGFATGSFRISATPEGTAIVTTAGITTGHSFGKVTGHVGDTQVAILPLNATNQARVVGSTFMFIGEEYIISAYTIVGLFDRITLNRALVNNINGYGTSYVIRSGVPIRSLGAKGTLTVRVSLAKLSSHELLDIGTGSYADTNYPIEIYGDPVNASNSSQEIAERDVGRCFYVTTDQDGNFNVGPYFHVDQGSGHITLSADLALSNLDGIGFKRGVAINEFSIDTGMSDNASDTVPTETATRVYIERRLGRTHSGDIVGQSSLLPPTTGGFMALDGVLAMKGILNLDQHKIINVTDPTSPQDAVNLRSVLIGNLQDINLGNISANDIAVFTGVGNTIENAAMVGDLSLNIDSTAHTIDAQINPNVIINADINSTADIIQSKLLMILASARASAPTGTAAVKQAASGLSSFDTAQFTVTDGYVTVKDNGLVITKIAQIGTKTVLGNSGLSTANVTEVAYTSIIDLGGAIKKLQFGSSGFLRRTSSSSYVSDADYQMIEASSAYGSIADASKLITRDASGNFGANIADLSQLKLGANSVLTTNTTATGGYVQLYGYTTTGGILLGNGSLAIDKNTKYWNDSHQFKTQNGISDAPITASGITCTSISTGGNTSTGTITGRWTLTGTSPNESRLQATYSADLAEYYEGDKEYEVGTVLIFGGDNEVTITLLQGDTRVAGVVSNTAAFVMYDACPGHKNLVALQGRVPCKVVGKITKGDMLVTSKIAGVAVAAGTDVKVGTVVGKALTNYDSDHIGTIEIAVGRT